jgi:hypothetical protein
MQSLVWPLRGRLLALIILTSLEWACVVHGPRAGEDDDLGASSGEVVDEPASAGVTSGSGDTTGVGGAPSSASSGGLGAASPSSSVASGATGGGSPDNCYSEALDPQASVSDIVSSYGGSGYKGQIIEAMNRRFPAGAYLLQQQKNDPYFAQFSNSSSWKQTVGWFDTLVHEETHLFNAYHAIAQNKVHALYMRADLILYLPSDSNSFARSEIAPHLPPSLASSTYANTYLTGQQGTRGFNALLDELTCYVNEVPALAAFGEYYSGGVSLRDGAAAFLNFLQVYLKIARSQYPGFYSAAQSHPGYVDAVRTLWLRTHFLYDEVGDNHPQLGIHDKEYRAEMHKAANMKEISLFIGQTVSDSHCL